MGAESVPAAACAGDESNGTATERPIDRLCRVAARLLDVPMAGLSLVGDTVVRLRSAIGLEIRALDRAGSFCGPTVDQDSTLIVPDTLADPRFRDTDLVAGPQGIRFYLGIPVRDATGHAIGVLCCMDRAPRPAGVARADLAALEDLALLAAETLRQDAAAERLADHLQAVFDAMPLPLMTIDAAGTITGWNPAAEQVFGWTAAEAIGRFGPHVPVADIPAARALRAGTGQRLVGVELVRLHRDGTRLPVSISTAPLRDAAGRPDGAVVVTEDISARRAAEAEAAAHTAQAERQAALLTGIATAMPTAGADLGLALRHIATAAVQGTAPTAAEAVCEAGVWLHDAVAGDLALAMLVGAGADPIPADAPRRRTLENLPFPPEFAAALRAERQLAAEDALADPRLAQLREPCLRPLAIGALLAAPIRAGQDILGLVAVCGPGPRRWTAGQRAFIASLADLAAVALESGRRAQAMVRLAEARDRAEAASRAKSRFLGTLSHELRTPLNAIIGFSDLLRLPSLPADQRVEFAGHVVAAGHQLLGIFDAMLDQARIESGSFALAEAEVALHLLLEDAVRLALPEATPRGIRIDPFPTVGLPPLRADPTRLRQAVLHLLANAVKFSPDHGRVETAASFEPGSGYRLAIADAGPGIAAADLPLAFEPFRQLDEGLRRRAGGTGLGLPLAKAFIEAHGGTLVVDSAPGQGTRVTLSLPASRALPN